MEFVTLELVTQLFTAAYAATAAVEANKLQSAQIGLRIRTILSLLNKFNSSTRSRTETQDILENLHGISKEIILFVEKFNNRNYFKKLWKNSTDFECFADFNNRLDFIIQMLSLGVAMSSAARAAQNDADARARSEDLKYRIDMLHPSESQIAELTKILKNIEGYIIGGREELAKSRSLDHHNTKSGVSALRKIRVSEIYWHKDGRIGEGSFGEVFKGIYKGEPVAVKVLKSSGEDDLKELVNESQIMQAIDHPCVVNMIAVVYNEWRAESLANVSCIVMNLASCSLHKLLYSTKDTIVNDGVRPPTSYLINSKSDRFCFSLAFRLALLKNVASAIAYIHSVGIIHRDIKPLNVLIDGYFRGKVCDFGLARVKQSASTFTNATMQTSPKGTLAYMPRETLQNCVYSKQGDAFAVGILVNEVLTGRSPFEGVASLLVPYQISCGKRPRVMIAPESDGVLQDSLQCILACWSDDVRSRPTAEAVCSTIFRCLHVSGGDPRNRRPSAEYMDEEPIEVSAELYTSSIEKIIDASGGSNRTAALSGNSSLPAPKVQEKAAEEKARIAAEEKAAEEKARIAAEAKARIAAEEKARLDAEKKARRDTVATTVDASNSESAQPPVRFLCAQVLDTCCVVTHGCIILICGIPLGVMYCVGACVTYYPCIVLCGGH